MTNEAQEELRQRGGRAGWGGGGGGLKLDEAKIRAKGKV